MAKIKTGGESWVYMLMTLRQKFRDPNGKRVPLLALRRHVSQSRGHSAVRVWFQETNFKLRILQGCTGTLAKTMYGEKDQKKMNHWVPPSSRKCAVLQLASGPRVFVPVKGSCLFTHPPYSPDLAPCDFWFFPKIKNRAKTKTFWQHSGHKEDHDGTAERFFWKKTSRNASNHGIDVGISVSLAKVSTLKKINSYLKKVYYYLLLFNSQILVGVIFAASPVYLWFRQRVSTFFFF